MILESGTSVLIVHRRLFATDRPRYFVGRVDAYESGIARVTGQSWVQDDFTGALIGKRESVRTKLIPISAGTLLCYALPLAVNLDEVAFTHDTQGRLWLTAGNKLRLEISEGHHAPVY